MLKLAFFFLLLVNGALFAWHQAYFAPLLAGSAVGREPERMGRQLHADKLRLLGPQGGKAAPAPAPAADAGASAAPGNPAPGAAAEGGDAAASGASVPAQGNSQAGAADAVPAAVEGAAASAAQEPGATAVAAGANVPETQACTEIGNFSEADADRFEERLAALAAGAQLTRRTVREAGSHMVYMPAQGSKEKADRKVDELRALGIKDFYVIQDQSELRWGISLGVFGTEAAARKRLDQLREAGVRTARVGARNMVARVAVQVRGLEVGARDGLARIKADFPQQQQRACS